MPTIASTCALQSRASYSYRNGTFLYEVWHHEGFRPSSCHHNIQQLHVSRLHQLFKNATHLQNQGAFHLPVQQSGSRGWTTTVAQFGSVFVNALQNVPATTRFLNNTHLVGWFFVGVPSLSVPCSFKITQKTYIKGTVFWSWVSRDSIGHTMLVY